MWTNVSVRPLSRPRSCPRSSLVCFPCSLAFPVGLPGGHIFCVCALSSVWFWVLSSLHTAPTNANILQQTPTNTNSRVSVGQQFVFVGHCRVLSGEFNMFSRIGWSCSTSDQCEAVSNKLRRSDNSLPRQLGLTRVHNILELSLMSILALYSLHNYNWSKNAKMYSWSYGKRESIRGHEILSPLKCKNVAYIVTKKVPISWTCHAILDHFFTKLCDSGSGYNTQVAN